jgi:hypothetical protein
MEQIGNYLNEEQLSQIEQLAAANYSLPNIAKYLDIPLKTLDVWMTDEDSSMYIAYHKGILEAQFEIDSKLLANAKSGNITAVQIFDKHKEKNELEEYKRKILYGG